MPVGKKLGEIYVDIAGRLTKLKASMAKGKKMLLGWSKGLTKLLKKAGIALGMVLVAALTLAVKAAVSFEQQMAKVATMLTAQTLKLIPKLGRAIKDMAIRFGEGTKSITEGLYSILSASISVGKAIGVLRASMMAAKGGFTDTATAANIITTALNSYGIAADRAMEISDKFLMVQKRGKTSLAEFAVPMGKVLGLAAALGVPLEEVNAALATLTRNGIPTAEALTSIRGAMVALTGRSAAGVKIAKDYNISLSATVLAGEGLLGMMEKFSKLTPDVTGKIITEVEALTAIAILTKDLSGFTEDLNHQFNAAGETMRAKSLVTATLAEKFKSLWQSIKMLATDTGTIFLPMIKNVVDSLIEKFKSMRDELIGIWTGVEGDFGDFFSVLSKIGMVKVKEFFNNLVEYTKTYAPYIASIMMQAIRKKASKTVLGELLFGKPAPEPEEGEVAHWDLMLKLRKDRAKQMIRINKMEADGKIKEILRVAGAEEGHKKHLEMIEKERLEREAAGKENADENDLARLKKNEEAKKRLAKKYAAERAQALKESAEQERDDRRKRLESLKSMYSSMEGYEKEFAKVQRALWRMQAEEYAKTGLVTAKEAYGRLAAKGGSKGVAGAAAEARGGFVGFREAWNDIATKILNKRVEQEQLNQQKELVNQAKIGNDKTDTLIDAVRSQPGGFIE